MKVLTEIKKELYKQKPEARFIAQIDKAGIDYRVYKASLNNEDIEFHIPINESTRFDVVEPSQLLIRWIVLL